MEELHTYYQRPLPDGPVQLEAGVLVVDVARFVRVQFKRAEAGDKPANKIARYHLEQLKQVLEDGEVRVERHLIEFIRKVEYAEHDFEKEHGYLSRPEREILNRMKKRDAALAATKQERKAA